MKKLLCLILSLSIILSISATSFAYADAVNGKTIEAATISETKTKTANVVSRATGQVIGKVTLTYKTQIIGGRPQFVYDQCFITYEFYSYYRGNVEMVSFSGDYIRFKVSYQQFIDSGYVYIGFTP